MNIEALAREAGLCCDKGHWFSPAGDPEDEIDVSTEDLTRFAALIRAQALEDAARACEARAEDHEESASLENDSRFAVYAKHERRCASAVRALKDKP